MGMGGDMDIIGQRQTRAPSSSIPKITANPERVDFNGAGGIKNGCEGGSSVLRGVR
jgi:hypothetical protein